MVRDLSYAEIVAQLNDRAEDVARDTLANPKRIGNEIKGDCQGKVAVVVKGGKTGVVLFTAGQGPGKSDIGGNLIHLIELANRFSRHGDAVRFAKRHYLGLGDELTCEEVERLSQQRKQARHKQAARQSEEEGKQKAKRALARRIWREAVPIDGTLAEEYLLKRGLPKMDWPGTLRFHPSVEWELGRGKGELGPFFPCLVAARQLETSKLAGIWRIFLPPSLDPLTKGRICQEPSKIALGSAPGASVRLGPVGEKIALCEGIETGLAIVALTRNALPVWCGCSTSGVIGIRLPGEVRSVVIYADGDVPRKSGGKVIQPGRDAALKAKENFTAQGRGASIVEPPAGSDFLNVWETVNAHGRERRNIQYV